MYRRNCPMLGRKQNDDGGYPLFYCMETINAVKKETLVKVIRWFWNNCVDVEANE